MTHPSGLLFQDIHYMALDKGETALAEVARRKAEQVDSESLGIIWIYHGCEGWIGKSVLKITIWHHEAC